MKPHTLSEKKKLVPKGKKLDPIKVKHAAENLWGREYRKTIREKLTEKKLQCSEPLISIAFAGAAPYMLYMINSIIKENSN